MARNYALAIAAAILCVAVCGVSSQAPTMMPAMASAPAPSLDCLTLVTNLSDCLTYVTPGSNLTKPDKPCCPELKGLVDSNPICLCTLLGQAGSYGIDVGRALKLPSVCKISTPPLSLCALAGVPVGVPTPSEGSTTGTPPGSVPSSRPAAAAPTFPSIAQAPSPAPAGNAKGSNGASRVGRTPDLVLPACIGLFFCLF